MLLALNSEENAVFVVRTEPLKVKSLLPTTVKVLFVVVGEISTEPSNVTAELVAVMVLLPPTTKFPAPVLVKVKLEAPFVANRLMLPPW